MVSAKQASDEAQPGNMVIGWKLDRAERDALLRQMPSKFAETIADHVTLKSKVAPNSPLPDEKLGEIVGRADDGDGVEALVVSIGGTTDRPDGGTYHITWSLGPDRHARESNDVIARLGWQPVDPIAITLKPECFG